MTTSLLNQASPQAVPFVTPFTGATFVSADDTTGDLTTDWSGELYEWESLAALHQSWTPLPGRRRAVVLLDNRHDGTTSHVPLSTMDNLMAAMT